MSIDTPELDPRTLGVGDRIRITRAGRSGATHYWMRHLAGRTGTIDQVFAQDGPCHQLLVAVRLDPLSPRSRRPQCVSLRLSSWHGHGLDKVERLATDLGADHPTQRVAEVQP